MSAPMLSEKGKVSNDPPPEKQGQNLALAVFCVPYSLDSGHTSPGSLQGYLAYESPFPEGPYRRPTPRVLGGS